MLLAATLLAFAAATVSAWLLVRRRREYLPIALLLTLGLVCDLGGEIIRTAYLDAQPRPYVDLARVLFHLEQALFLAWPAGVVGCSLFLLASRKFRDCATKTGGAWFAAVLAAWVVAVALHVIGYPTLRQDTLALVLRIEQGIAVAVLAWCAVAWSANDRARKPEHAAALVIAVAEAHVLLFVHSGANLFELWWLAQIVYLCVFSWITIGQVRWVWTR